MLLTSSFTLTLRFTLAKISHCCLRLPIFASQCHPVVILFPCTAINCTQKDMYKSYLFKAADVTAEDLSTRMSLDHDFSLLLGLCGKIQPAFHCLAPEKRQCPQTRAI